MATHRAADNSGWSSDDDDDDQVETFRVKVNSGAASGQQPSTDEKPPAAPNSSKASVEDDVNQLTTGIGSIGTESKEKTDGQKATPIQMVKPNGHEAPQPPIAKSEAEPKQQSNEKEAPVAAENEFSVTVKLADLQADPESPLYSIQRFEDLGLSEKLLKGIYAMGFQKPSKIQERALPLLLANPPKNLIGQSQSGTGKTAAFVLSMLSRVDTSKNCVQALCLAPARELARQIMDVVVAMGKYTGVTAGFAIKESLRRGGQLTDQIIIGTPGTVLDAIRRGQLRVNNVHIFVLDEADNMLDQQNLGEQCNRVKKSVPPSAQLLLFSATFNNTVYQYANKFAPNANEITLRREELSVKGIKQLYLDCASEGHKYEVLVALYSLLTIGSSIIFVKTRASADRIADLMVNDGHQVSRLHGDQSVEERDSCIDEFRSGRTKVLITTNVLARGIDIASISMVVNYDLPTVHGSGNPERPDFETYLHRIGRTGRFGRVGVSISFVHSRASWIEMNAYQQYFGVEMIKVPTDDVDEMEKVIKGVLKG